MICDALFPIAMFGLPGGVEWIVILVIALLLFGRRLPEIMRGLGGSVREFKKGLDTDEAPPAVPPAANPAPPGAISRGESGASSPGLASAPTNPVKAPAPQNPPMPPSGY